jgi:hypothetical protein
MKTPYRGGPRGPSSAETGTALLMILVLLTLLLGFVGSSVVALSRIDARVVIDERDRSSALYLADGSLDALKYELDQDTDLSGDGIGNHTVATADGSVSATATLLSSGRYELLSAGTVDGISVQLREIVVFKPASMPDGALSVVGGAASGKVQVLTSSKTNLIIDGGADSPGIVLTDSDFHDEFVKGIQDGIDNGYVDESQLTGNGLTGVATIEEGTTPAEFDDFYNDIRDKVTNDILPIATNTVLPGGSVTWGTAVAPQTRKFVAGQKLTSGRTVNGYGTLVFNRDLVIESGGTLNWHGDVFIFGDTTNDAIFEIDGTMNVTGNVVLITGGNRNATFLIKSNGVVNVEGTLNATTNYNTAGTKLQFLVENKLTVTGMLTTGASIHQTEYKPGCDVLIEGLYNFVMPPNADAQDVQFKLDGPGVAGLAIEILRDESAYQDAVAGMGSIGSDLELGVFAVPGNFDCYGWQIQY